MPFTEIANELGTSLMKNMVAIGATSAVLDLPAEAYTEVVEEIFYEKALKSLKRTWKPSEGVRLTLWRQPADLLQASS